MDSGSDYLTLAVLFYHDSCNGVLVYPWKHNHFTTVFVCMCVCIFGYQFSNSFNDLNIGVERGRQPLIDPCSHLSVRRSVLVVGVTHLSL